MTICWLFPLFVKIYFQNVQSPMTSLCNNLVLLFEFILQRFFGSYSYSLEEFIAVG